MTIKESFGDLLNYHGNVLVFPIFSSCYSFSFSFFFFFFSFFFFCSFFQLKLSWIKLFSPPDSEKLLGKIPNIYLDTTCPKQRLFSFLWDKTTRTKSSPNRNPSMPFMLIASHQTTLVLSLSFLFSSDDFLIDQSSLSVFDFTVHRLLC